ncbi:MAG: hypothetical protein JZD41_01415 [Thermoproteus sp.]|nr:hypothetical protein [Thermoproteus sp.]
MIVENKKGRFLLRPDSPLNYRRVYADTFSLAASLSDREELFRGLAGLMDQAAMEGRELEVVLVLDAWSDTHLPLAREYARLAEEYGLPYTLSERKPAELYAVELCELCAPDCAVLTRDYDAINAAVKCPVLVARAGRAYRARPWRRGRGGAAPRRGGAGR